MTKINVGLVNHDRPLWGIFLYLSQAACFLVIGMLVKHLTQFFSIVELLLIRFLVTFVVLLFIIKSIDRFIILYTQKPLDHMIRTFCGMAALGLSFVALSNAMLADATAVILSAPIFAVILSFFVLSEQITKPRFIAAGLGFLGVLAIVQPGFSDSGIGLYAAFGSAILFSIVMVWIRKLNHTEHPLCISFYYNLTGTIIFLIWTFLTGFSSIWVFDFQSMGFLILLGFTGASQQILLSYSFRYADTSLLAPFEYLCLPLSFLIGFILWNEIPNWLSLVGAGTIIVCGTMLLSNEFSKNKNFSHKRR